MSNVMLWSIVLIGMLIAGFIVVAQVKKRMTRDEDLSGGGFSLGDLRDLHRQGKMSTEEFEKAKAAVVDAMKRAEERRAQEQARRKAAAERRGQGLR